MNHLVDNLSLWELALLVSAILLGVVIIFGIIVPICKPKIDKKSTIYLYSFATGFFIVLATYGLMRESFEDLQANHNKIVTTVVVTSGTLLGMMSGFGARWFVSRRNVEIHADHSAHRHSDAVFSVGEIDNPKSKWVAIWLLLSHRIVAGLTLGILVAEAKTSGHGFAATFSLAMILAFIFHIIPEVLIVYYRQIEAGVSKWRAIGNSLIFKLIMIPLILAGAYIGDWFNQNASWLVPLLISVSGGAIAFTSVFELIPEFLDNTDQSKSKWYKVTIIVIVGFVLATLILSIDV